MGAVLRKPTAWRFRGRPATSRLCRPLLENCGRGPVPALAVRFGLRRLPLLCGLSERRRLIPLGDIDGCGVALRAWVIDSVRFRSPTGRLFTRQQLNLTHSVV